MESSRKKDDVRDQSGIIENEEMQAAIAQVWKQMYGFAESLTLKCAVDLGIPDILHKRGKPMTLSEIAGELTIPSPNLDRLHRIMRLLVHMKLFALVADNGGTENNNKYALTPASKLFLRAEEKNLVSYFSSQVSEDGIGPWHYLITGIEGKTTPLLAWLKEPLEYAERLEKDPEYNKLMNDSMANQTSFVVEPLVQVCAKEGVLHGITTLVDVAGATGVACRAIANAFPHVKCTVLEIPQVVKTVPIDPKVDFVAGDAFDYVPKADAVLMKSFLHDFDDDDCLKILKNCREAIPQKTGKVILVEIVVDIDGTPEFTGPRLCMDLVMSTFGGRERTKEEWKILLTRAGFGDIKITPMPVNEAIIEAFP